MGAIRQGGGDPFISLSQSDYLYGNDLFLKLLDQVMEVKLDAFWRCPHIYVAFVFLTVTYIVSFCVQSCG